MDADWQTPATLDPTIFTSPFFLSAAHTWQDQLFSSWLGQKASDDFETFKKGAKDGTLQCPRTVERRSLGPRSPADPHSQKVFLDTHLLYLPLTLGPQKATANLRLDRPCEAGPRPGIVYKRNYRSCQQIVELRGVSSLCNM
ncbi:hypothetical protein L226DRAFT_141527 [Lentinus tigrinus ALCF2SS1-7]|uniref:uncharacterized protein n=1 Tax=Lentinus tigrinus ALCF2SS1-7 TaxID=1328758 RepID=UPI0011661C71|nr:hypothetical protein L226DRAFT_141527 [Lentinus tigrinus ALCF2SS1-7]